MRTSENKMCDNQPHTEAAGKERLFSVYVCMCECHDQKTKGRKNGKESRRIVNASYIIIIYINIILRQKPDALFTLCLLQYSNVRA